MPALTAMPTLHKPKSKIRLRLGLTPPHPKLVKQPYSVPSSSVDSSLQYSAASHTTTSANDPIPNPTYSGPTSSLHNSSNTFSSQQSGTDSRDAYAFEHDRSGESANSAPSPDPAFDVISYTTASPISFHRPASPQETISPSRVQLEDGQNHPNITAAATADDIFSLSDEQLSDRFTFITEIGFGNWGSVWLCKPKHARASMLHTGMGRLGRTAAAGGGSGAGGKVAIKLVHRSKTPTTATRVRALWGEMKIIRALRHEPHPSIIQFEAFVITPSYALVIMPHLSHLIPVCLPPSRATPYFRQLASALGYLHERGITHNDIKPANVLLSHNDIPVLVDFGFAQKWEVGGRGSFLSSISWGTPEYLDPQRAKGMPHDERASDVWSLGITMFEILIGRTPFEASDEEQFTTPEELVIYYDRTRHGVWVGRWSMPDDLQHLLRTMICPDPAHRITAMQAYHHPALFPSAPSVIITPHFVRTAASFNDVADEPMPPPPADGAKKGKKRRDRKKEAKDQPRVHTPTALGESIKQHTSVTRPKAVKGDEKSPSPRKGSVLVIRPRDGQSLSEGREEDKESQDPTPTKVVKPAQPLRVKDMSHSADNAGVAPTESSQVTNLSQPPSTQQPITATLRASTCTDLFAAPAPKTKQEAVLKAMRSLEGVRHEYHAEKGKHFQRDVLSAISRPAPEPPRPKSLDSAQDAEKESSERKADQRRSLGLEKVTLAGVREQDVQVEVFTSGKAAVMVSIENPASVEIRPRPVSPSRVKAESQRPPMSPARASSIALPIEPSPARPRLAATRPTDILVEGEVFPGTDPNSPLAELTQRIMSNDQEKLVRFKQISEDLIAPAKVSTRSSRIARTSMPVSQVTEPVLPPIPRTRSVEALALEGRLDQIAHWIKDVERIVEDARKAIAEGRQSPLPIPALPSAIHRESRTVQPVYIANVSEVPASAIPEHLRGMSTQAQPATPPKWMTYAEAEETVKQANEWIDEGGPKGKAKKDRSSVSHMLKMFGTENEAKLASRTNTPEPLNVPLKPPQLRGVPSTPALRSSSRNSRLGLTRKSESNLRNSKLIPTSRYQPKDEDEEQTVSPRRAVYEELLVSAPGVVRQGNGWSSFSSGRGMAKPSSMASLRERAIAYLRDDRELREPASTGIGTGRNIVDLAAEVRTKRPETPGAGSVFNSGKSNEGHGKVKGKGFFGRLKQMAVGKGKAMDSA